MSHLTTTTSTLQEVYTPATCAYCSGKIEFLPPVVPVTRLKLECALCGYRSLVNSADPTTSSRFSVFLPAETIDSILRHWNVYSPLLYKACLVSRFWNECATPILYGDLYQSWDSRMKPLLGARPDLLSLLHSREINYPRLELWIGIHREYWRIFGDERNRIEEEERAARRVRQLLRDTREYPDGIIHSLAAAWAKPRWREAAEIRAAADWMDMEEGTDEPRRREGALALFALASRCPSLQFLTLVHFDFGTSRSSDDEQDASGPALLPSVEELALLHAQRSLRTPDLTKTSTIHPVIALPTLHHLTSLSLNDVIHVRHLVSVLAACPILRTLTLRLDAWDDVEAEVPALLLHVPRLESLALLTPVAPREDPGPSPYPGASLPAAFAASTTLRHLHLACHLSKSILASLPVSLTSLKTRWIHPPNFPSRSRGLIGRGTTGPIP